MFIVRKEIKNKYNFNSYIDLKDINNNLVQHNIHLQTGDS